MNSSYDEEGSSSSEEEEDRRRAGRRRKAVSSDDEEEEEEEDSSSSSDDEDEEDSDDDSDEDTTSSEDVKKKKNKKGNKKTGGKTKKKMETKNTGSGLLKGGKGDPHHHHQGHGSNRLPLTISTPVLPTAAAFEGGGSRGSSALSPRPLSTASGIAAPIERSGSGTLRNRSNPPLTDSTSVLVRGMRVSQMTDEEREQQIEREREKQQRKDERKKAIKNLDTIISSLQELEDLPHVEQNGRRPTLEGGRSSGYDTVGARERWSARNAGSSHNESYSSDNDNSTDQRGEGDEKDRSGSRGEKGDEATNLQNINNSGGSGNSSGRDAITGSSAKDKDRGKEKEKKAGGLARLSIFHKRSAKEPPKRESAKKVDTKKKATQRKGEDDNEEGNEDGFVRVERKNKKKESLFNKMYEAQVLGEQEGGHYGAIWVMQFSPDGRYLATAGSDGVLRVWRVAPKLSTDDSKKGRITQYLDPVCFKTFPGHTLDILSISWSNNEFLLSSSMDCTVRLWHLSCDECVSCFEHKDFVTTVAFHPINNKVFMSGGLDKRIYVWNIPRKRIAYQIEISDMITAGAFVPEKGEYLVVGTDTGRLLFCEAEEAITKEPTGPEPEDNTPRATIEIKVTKELHIHTSRFKGRDHTRRKITGIDISKDGKTMLVSSNDSSARLYRTKDYALLCKYAGYCSKEFQVKATLSNDGKYVIAGSEDPNVFLWEAGKEKRNKACEYFQVADDEGMATAALFAPPAEDIHGQIVVAASLEGDLHVYHNLSADASG